MDFSIQNKPFLTIEKGRFNPYIFRTDALNREHHLVENKAFINEILIKLRTNGQLNDKEILDELHKTLDCECQRLLNSVGFEKISSYPFYTLIATDKIDALLLWSHTINNTSDNKADARDVFPDSLAGTTLEATVETSDQQPVATVLTEKKQQFLKEPKKSLTIDAWKVGPIANFYAKKYPGVIILKNGQSPLGLELIKTLQNGLREEYEETKSRYTDENTKYVEVAKWGFLRKDKKDNYGYSLFPGIISGNQYDFFRKLLVCYLDRQTNKYKNPTDLTKVGEIIRHHLSLKPVVDEVAIRYLHTVEQHLQQNLDNNLKLDDINKEIKFIQHNLSGNEVVGYVFTGKHLIDADHFEVVLISKEMIIKPLSWPGGKPGTSLAYKPHAGTWSEVMLDSPLVLKSIDEQDEKEKKIPWAQSDIASCGSLGFLYLKELLKDDCRQLNDYTLSFPINGEKESPWFFYPSPHVLRYSQSQKYNEIFRKMLEDTEGAQITDDKKYEISTLKYLLIQSIEAAQNTGDQGMVMRNTTILEKLPEFRKKWIAVYDAVIKKREMMTYTNAKGENKDYIGKNQELAAASHRINAKADERIN